MPFFSRCLALVFVLALSQPHATCKVPSGALESQDEAGLYALWQGYLQGGCLEAMLALIDAFKSRFPHSPLLQRMKQDLPKPTPRAKTDPEDGWRGQAQSQYARSRTQALDNIVANRIKGEYRHSRHQGDKNEFGEFAAASLKSKPGENLLHRFQFDLGGSWRRGPFGLEASWGLGYDAVSRQDTLIVDPSNSESNAQFTGWNARMAQIEGDYVWGWPNGLWLNSRLGLRLVAEDWWAMEATLYSSYRWEAWNLSGLLHAQGHAMDWSFSQPDTLAGGEAVVYRYAMKRMQVVQGEVTPGYRLGKNDWTLGLGYFLLRLDSQVDYTYSGITEAFPRDFSHEHTLTLNPAYRYRFAMGLKLKVGLSYGVVLRSLDHSRDYDAKPTYSGDMGMTFPFAF